MTNLVNSMTKKLAEISGQPNGTEQVRRMSIHQ